MSARARRFFSFLGGHLHSLAGPRCLAALFLICALPTGLGCALLSPISAPPDELDHIVRAEGLRLGQFTNAPSPAGHPGVMVNLGMFNVLLDELTAGRYTVTGNMPAAALAQMAAVKWNSLVLRCPTQMTLYFPLFYLPAAIGLAAGKAVGLGPFFAIYLARLVMLLSYIAMGVVALRLARCGGPLLFATLTLATAISLGASCSQDGQLIAACALASALLGRARAGPGPGWWVALALITAAVLAKFTYIPLLLLCLMPLRAPGLGRRAGLVALAALAPAFWLLHIHHLGFYPSAMPLYHPGPLWPGDRSVWLHDARPAYNILVLRSHPALILLLPFQSLAAQWSITWHRMVDCVSADVVLMRPWEAPCLAAALGLAALAAPPAEKARRHAEDAALGLLVLVGGFMGLELSLYLTYTFAGRPFVNGVHGRYFLLLLPFCGLPLAWLLARRPKAWPPAGLLSLPAVAMAVLNIYALPAFLYHFFRMAGP